jgi:hypothetical protein
MRVRWLAIVLLAVTVFVASGCASSRYGRYGRYDPVYRNRSVYSQRDRDYHRWERQQQRQREAWLRKQRRHERLERRRDRDWEYRRRRD